MSEPLENSVAHLRDQSQQLNAITDQATAAVRRVETFLNQECRLGLAVYVPIPPSGKTLPPPEQPMLQLGYARTGDRYRIVVRALAKDREEGSRGDRREEQIAWSECPRALKIDAFQQLPALLTALQTHLADVIARAGAALTAAQRITDVLGVAPEPEAGTGDDDCRDRERGHHGHHHHGHHEHGHHHDHGHGHHGHHDHGERGGERGERGERGEDRGPGRHKHKHGEGRGWDKG